MNIVKVSSHVKRNLLMYTVVVRIDLGAANVRAA